MPSMMPNTPVNTHAVASIFRTCCRFLAKPLMNLGLRVSAVLTLVAVSVSPAWGQATAFVFSPSTISELEITEGESFEFTLRLAVQPAGDVTFSLHSGSSTGRDRLTYSFNGVTSNPGTTLTFTRAAWFMQQTIRITAVDDEVFNGTAARRFILSYRTTGLAGTNPRFNGPTGTSLTTKSSPSSLLRQTLLRCLRAEAQSSP